MKYFIVYIKLVFFIGVIDFSGVLSVNAQVKPTAADAPPAETPIASPAAYPSNTPINYIRTRTPSMPTTSSTVVTSPGRSTTEVKQSTQYFDGLGRPLQTVKKAITPDGRDLVSPIVYDGFGREAYKYLPYPQTTANTNDGKFKLNPFNNQTTAIQSLNLYPEEDIYYGKTNYEASPLNRVLKTMSPGNSWTGSKRGVSQSYEFNTTNNPVRFWEIDPSLGSLPYRLSFYGDEMLYKHVATDADSNTVVTFKDTKGHLVLKKVAESSGLPENDEGWLCTYYVYDHRGNLRFVIPPKAVNFLTNHNWILTQTAADRLCFRYEYDDRNRIIIKKVPGAGEVQIVYDNRDRTVFKQDANQRANNQWLVTYYDELNRPIKTGIYTNASATRASLQLGLDTLATDGEENGGSGSEGGGDPEDCPQIPAPNDLTVTSRTNNEPAEYIARNSITFMPGFEAPAGDEFTAIIDPSAMIDDPNCDGGDGGEEGGSGGDTGGGISHENPVPPIDENEVQFLTYTYYDDYSWAGAQSFQSSYLSKTTDGDNPYAESPSTYSKTKGRTTGTKVRILDSHPEKWLTSTTYYDDKGRVLQTVSNNITGGTDVVTNKYDFSGKLLSSYVVNHNNNSTVSPETRVLTENKYDAADRLLTITKTINDQSGTKRTIATNSYNELGQLKTKELGDNLETLKYTYNIRGWLTGINPSYANGSGTHFFGMELNYDYGFTQNQYNGNIAGEKWRTSGDGKRRAYGFSYDSPGRLTKADFTQHTNGNWNIDAHVDYSSSISYDANGNIMSLDRKGLINNSSAPVDNLNYYYQTNSNQLDHVNDAASPPVGGAGGGLGDFKDGHTGSGDYSYDANGNLKKDLNKGISSITYNYLNKPKLVDFGAKGTIQFVYDATGNKLQKIVTDQTGSTTRKVVTTYLNSFVYRHIGSSAKDTLQYFPTEEGRVRYIAPHGSTAASFVYDYFIKDHLGNTRVVLTEQTDFSHYIATMEPDKEAKEEALFYNLNSTRTPKPVDYPQDNTTSPNQAVAKLNGKDPDKRIGPSIILKVMAGDTIQAAVRAYYKQEAAPEKKATIPAEQMLAGLIQALTAPAIQTMTTHGGDILPDQQLATPGLTANDLQQLKNKVPENKKLNKPKAYLNYVFFDKQLNFVEEGSGVRQVDGEAGKLETLSSGKVIAKENGYVYVFTSNESQEDVFFDNFGVMQVTGPVLEETHYYPFGLTMARISTKAPLKLENRFKFQGQELQHKEFSDGSGLETYQFKYRMDDPQIGRFWQIDPLAEKYVIWSPYVFSGNRVINARELEGLEPYIITGRTFIPNKTVKNPVRIFSKIKSFKGDNRKSYQVTTKSYRTEQKVRVDFDNRKATTLSNRANFSIGLDENGTQIVKSKPGKAGPTPTYNKSSMKNGTTTVHMKVDASNKLVDGAPAIDYEVNVTVTEQKNGTFKYKIQGKSDGFPAYEFFITNEANEKSYLIYGNNPNHTGSSPTSLFPPMDENINESGNSTDLGPVEKVKF